MKIAVICVGNRLMLDDGLGPVVYDQLQSYRFEPEVDLFDVGCMTMNFVNVVRDYDLLMTVDAVDGSDELAGTIFRYTPDEVAPRAFGTQSLHELQLSDLFESAALLGYEAQGICLGMQVENASPPAVVEGLTPAVAQRIDDLVDCVLAELVKLGIKVRVKETGECVEAGYHHTSTIEAV